MFNILHRIGVRLYLIPFQIFSFLFLRRKKMKIVTCSNSDFYAGMIQLINSIKIHEKGNYSIVVYDLGLTDQQISNFKAGFPEIQLREFDFNKFPSYYNLSVNSGAYAWKPEIIYEEYNAKTDEKFLFWLDAGCVVKRQLLVVRAALYFYGFYSTLSGGFINNLTLTSTIEKLGLSKYKNCNMLSGGIIGFLKNTKKNNLLINNWVKSARNKEIISPERACKENHRFDQSIVSLLFYKIYNTKSQSIISKKGLEIVAHKNIWL